MKIQLTDYEKAMKTGAVHDYYRLLFSKLLPVNPKRAEEIQAMPIDAFHKGELLEKELGI